MSDQMMLNILRMPVDDRGDVHMAQFIATAQDAADRIEELTKERDALADQFELLKAQRDTLAAQLNRYSMDASHADQRLAESRAVRRALGFNGDADHVSPRDLTKAIAQLRAQGQANGARAIEHMMRSVIEEYVSEMRRQAEGGK